MNEVGFGMEERRWGHVCKGMRCSNPIPLSFYHNEKQEYCDECLEYQEQDEDRDKLENRLKKYGISPWDYDRILKKQNGVCAICKRAPTTTYGLQVDHDHKTGKVRGLLCGKCNTCLAMAEDNPTSLREAALYLKDRI